MRKPKLEKESEEEQEHERERTNKRKCRKRGRTRRRSRKRQMRKSTRKHGTNQDTNENNQRTITMLTTSLNKPFQLEGVNREKFSWRTVWCKKREYEKGANEQQLFTKVVPIRRS